MQKYPTLYNKDLADDDDFRSMDEKKSENIASSSTPAENPKQK